MAQNTLKSTGNERLKFAVAGAIALLFLLFMVSWGGAISDSKLPAFVIGVAALVATLCAFAFAFWYLLVRPLPARHRIAATGGINASYRQVIAFLLGVASLNIVVGGFWDEVWHRLYGIPFGEDFFWRPHFLMYFGFLTVMVLGGLGLYAIVRQMKGTLAQRFHAAPTIGLLVLVTGFMLYALPADPLWHQIYGEDLTAWSIPHLLLLLNFTTIMLVAVAIQLSMIPGREWQSVARLTAYDILPLLMFASVILINLQLFTTEYDDRWAFASPIMRGRPEWVLPLLIAGVAAFVGVLANHSLRYFGAATVAGLLALGLRVGLIQIFEAEQLRASGWIVAILPLVAIDFWYAFCVQRKRAPGGIGGGVAAAIGMLGAYPVMEQLYPQLVITNLSLMAAMVLIASLSAGWLGAQIGDYIGTQNKQVRSGGVPLAVPLASVGALVVLVVFMLFFIRTATPPL